MATLSAAKAKALNEPGRYGDGGGLYLSIAKGGSKSWIQRVRVGGKRRDIGLGGFPTVTLAKARELAADNRGRVAEGKAPLSAKERRSGAARARTAKTSAPTFEALCRAFHAENTGARWTNAKNVKNFIHRAEKYIFPAIGDKPIDKITGADVLDILIPLQAKGETARKVRVIMRQTFARAQARELVTVNPAGESINGGLPPIRQTVKHMKALHYEDVAEALAQIDATDSYETVKLGFKFQVLTAARPGEARHARWSEIDLDAATWTISAADMKSEREHKIPLSTQALDLLDRARMLSWGDEYVFPSPLGSWPVSENTYGKALKSAGVNAVPHGFRSSFKTWAAVETSASWAAVESSLAHSIGSDVERAYFRSDLLDQRRELLQGWADYLR